MASAAKPQSTGGAALSKDTLEQLESLGYVGGGGSGAAESGSDLKLEDPKDFVAVFEHCKAGTELMRRRRYEEARKELQAVVSKRPKLVLAHLFLGEVAIAQLHAGRRGTGVFDRPVDPGPVQGPAHLLGAKRNADRPGAVTRGWARV